MPTPLVLEILSWIVVLGLVVFAVAAVSAVIVWGRRDFRRTMNSVDWTLEQYRRDHS